MFEILIYETEQGNSSFQKYMNDIIHKRHLQEECYRITSCINRLKEHGLALLQIHPKDIKHLKSNIYELRPDRHRIIFFAYTENKFVILHAFYKTTTATPPAQIKKAERERDDWVRRNKS